MGTRNFDIPFSGIYEDHPHAYGDKLQESRTLLRPLGSSPRVWGQGLSALHGGNFARIIPTRMGTRISSTTNVAEREDHPHAYGDKSSLKSQSIIFAGSSPRVWGQDRAVLVQYLDIGIIPTRMGTSLKAVDAIIRE